MEYGSYRRIGYLLTPPVRIVRQRFCLRFISKWKAVGDINYIAESAVNGEGKQLEGERRPLCNTLISSS